MSVPAYSWRRVSPIYWLRPAEWIVLVFTGYLVFRAMRDGATLAEDNAPRADMLAALMLAVLASQVHRYRRVPWPEDSMFVRKHWMLFPLTLVPLGLEAFALSNLPDWDVNGHNGGYLFGAILAAHWLLERFAFMGLPLVLLWLALGSHLKLNDGIQGRQFLGEMAGGLGNALRDWAPPVMLTFLYGVLGSVLGHSSVPDQDARLAAADRFLFFGHNPVWELQRVASRPVSEWMAFCYGFYAPIYPLCFGLLFAQTDKRGFRELALAITMGLSLGYLSYMAVPALGPAFTQHFEVPLDDYYFKWMKEQLMDKYRVPRDCFPSMHTCVSFTFLWAARRHLRPLYWFLLPIVATIPVACLYLRYHYFVDLLGGAALFAWVAWVTPRLIARHAAAWRAAETPASA